MARSRIDLYFQQRGEDTIESNFDGPVGVDVAPPARDAGRLARAMRTLAGNQEGPGWTLIHGDAHVGNVFLGPDGHPSLVDWQLVQRNYWGIDIGYHIASAISTEDRERSERDLVRHYLDELTGARRAGTVVGRGVDRVSGRHGLRILHVGHHDHRQAGDRPGAAATSECRGRSP